MEERAVTNSTCLIGLERRSQTELLPQVFTTVFAPPMVVTEIRSYLGWLRVQPVQNTAIIANLKTQMDPGEAETIALALELENVTLILDDKKARRVALEKGLRVTGTLGILLRAKSLGVINEIKPLLDELLQADFRLSDRLIKEALKRAGEES
ncbi:MAG: DUF3368 domain-containing protein [Okeania sp. SIO2H7]|nr:DUF3368 domain-containing protein [Okeania sp. SIO2H7]